MEGAHTHLREPELGQEQEQEEVPEQVELGREEPGREVEGV